MAVYSLIWERHGGDSVSIPLQCPPSTSPSHLQLLGLVAIVLQGICWVCAIGMSRAEAWDGLPGQAPVYLQDDSDGGAGKLPLAGKGLVQLAEGLHEGPLQLFTPPGVGRLITLCWRVPSWQSFF